MMELRIKITRKNARKIARLIEELARLEVEETILGSPKEEARGFGLTEWFPNYLAPPPRLENLRSGNVLLDSVEARHVGTWGQFNSFFPVKAVLRVLAHIMSENNGKAVNLQKLVNVSKEVFEQAGLGRYRGFPSSSKPSAIGRLVWHFIIPAHQMGLIHMEGAENISTKEWEKVYVSLTREGLEFARLENPIFDKGSAEQVLSKSEREWILNYLKEIDAKGYKEYSFLRRIFEELKRGNTNIPVWLQNDEKFNEYVKSWSRKRNDPAKFKKQLEHVATMFAQSKIALLRELGMISCKRNDYSVIGDER